MKIARPYKEKGKRRGEKMKENKQKAAATATKLLSKSTHTQKIYTKIFDIRKKCEF